jgi:hypothetical protein
MTFAKALLCVLHSVSHLIPELTVTEAAVSPDMMKEFPIFIWALGFQVYRPHPPASLTIGSSLGTKLWPKEMQAEMPHGGFQEDSLQTEGKRPLHSLYSSILLPAACLRTSWVYIGRATRLKQPPSLTSWSTTPTLETLLWCPGKKLKAVSCLSCGYFNFCFCLFLWHCSSNPEPCKCITELPSLQSLSEVLGDWDSELFLTSCEIKRLVHRNWASNTNGNIVWLCCPCLMNKEVKKTGGLRYRSMIEHLPSMDQALGLTPRTTK